jgi:hypothetical protein
MGTKTPSMTLFRLAKKAAGLAAPEKRAIIAIADACSMADGVCRKSILTLSEEWGFPERSIRYGIRGRQRKDGTEYFPGLLKRGIVSAVEREGMPTIYAIDEARLESYSAVTSAQVASEPLHKNGVTPAQTANDPCTNDGEPLHSGSQVLNSILESVHKDSSRVSDCNAEKTSIETTADSENLRTLSVQFLKTTGACFEINDRVAARLSAVIAKHGMDAIRFALQGFANHDHDWSKVKNSAVLFLSKLDYYLGVPTE